MNGIWFLKSKSDSFLILLQPNQECTIGRQSNSHILISDPSSISKSHAVISTYNADSSLQIQLKDTSKYGSTILRNQEPITVHQNKLELKLNDVISFGKNSTHLYELCFKNIQPCHSSLDRKQVKVLESICAQFGIPISKQMNPKSTHLITTGKALTSKVIYALALGCHIVDINWLIQLNQMKNTTSFPLESDHLPIPIDIMDIKLDKESWLPNIKRKELFRGISFVFVSEKKVIFNFCSKFHGENRLNKQSISSLYQVDQFISMTRS